MEPMTDNLPFIWAQNENYSRSLADVFKEKQTQIRQILTEMGAILFRGFNIENEQKLEACSQTFPGKSVDYIGGNSPRTNINGKIYTSTEHPASAFISLHNELSYAKKWPKYILFCCAIPAKEGGHTLIADSRRILNGLSKELKDMFIKKGVQYIRNLHSGNGPGASWQATFETSDKTKIEEYCRANDISYAWDSQENLQLREKRSATLVHHETLEEVWFNQADQFHPSTNGLEVYEALLEVYDGNPYQMPQYACFNDDSEIPLEMLEHIREVTQKETVKFDWQKGDLLLLDNILVAHGRSSFKGPRKILVSMLE